MKKQPNLCTIRELQAAAKAADKFLPGHSGYWYLPGRAISRRDSGTRFARLIRDGRLDGA